MTLKTLISHQHKLQVAEVELELIPGLPQIHYLGLPDKIIKESFYRTKAALKNSGYEFPVSKQVIVNIKPNHLRKSSRGVELAIAIGLLLMTEQLDSRLVDPDWIIYGELGLDGRVYEPSDLASQFTPSDSDSILTGESLFEWPNQSQDLHRLKKLSEFETFQQVSKVSYSPQRPKDGLHYFFSEDEAQFLTLMALAPVHGLLAGTAGSGKSTLARNLISFLNPPQSYLQSDSRTHWLPHIETHSSITTAAFLGGGSQLYEGEIERVKGGLLILDEMLEYDSDILDSLRGPMTGQTLRLARSGNFREIKPTFKVVATTNFCPCGKWTPDAKNVSCRFSRTRCGRYLERLSGPLLDRFGIMYFYSSNKARMIDGQTVLENISKIQSTLNHVTFLEPQWVAEVYRSLTSRRLDLLTKVCQVIAARRVALSRDAEKVRSAKKAELTLEDYQQAEKWSLTPFQALDRGMS